jgi:hypothetical protein
MTAWLQSCHIAGPIYLDHIYSFIAGGLLTGAVLYLGARASTYHEGGLRHVRRRFSRRKPIDPDWKT